MWFLSSQCEVVLAVILVVVLVMVVGVGVVSTDSQNSNYWATENTHF